MRALVIFGVCCMVLIQTSTCEKSSPRAKKPVQVQVPRYVTRTDEDSCKQVFNGPEDEAGQWKCNTYQATEYVWETRYERRRRRNLPPGAETCKSQLILLEKNLVQKEDAWLVLAVHGENYVTAITGVERDGGLVLGVLERAVDTPDTVLSLLTSLGPVSVSPVSGESPGSNTTLCTPEFVQAATQRWSSQPPLSSSQMPHWLSELADSIVKH